jgi:hypothetical protein
MKNALIVLALIVGLSGCATSSGVLKMGPDTYSVNATASPARGGVSGAKRMVYEEANQECSKQGKEMLVVNERLTRTPYQGAGSVDLTFRCLSKGDPEMEKRPEYQDRPDVIIQDQRK